MTTTGRAAFAAFDFDGTMTRRDTLAAFLASVAGRGAVLRAVGRDPARLVLGAAGLADRDRAKERVVGRLLAGRPYAEVEAAGRSYGARLAATAVTRDARDRIAWHRDAGHDVVIVSASLDVYLVEVARALDVGHVLATTLEVDAAGRCTGRLQGGNCRGPEKAARLRALLGDTDAELWAYGNSAGDDAMLALAHHPVRVRRGRLRSPVPHHR